MRVIPLILLILASLNAYGADPFRQTPIRSLGDGADEKVQVKILGSATDPTKSAVSDYQAIVDADGDIHVKVSDINGTVNLPSGASTAAAQTDGTQRTQITNGTDNAAVETSAADAQSASTFGVVSKVFNFIFNGTTWERLRSAIVGNNVTATGIQAVAPYGQYRASQIEVTDGLYAVPGLTHNGQLYNVPYDHETERDIFIGQFQELKTAELTQLVGGNFLGTSLNSRIWTSTLANGGTAPVASGLLELVTNTTANGSAAVQSIDVAPFRPASPNTFLAGVRLGDTGTTNNERRFGAWTTTSGLYFKLAGTTFSVCRLHTSVETCVDSSSFTGTQNALTLDTNFHVYEIHYSSGTAMFFQDRKLLHTLSATTTGLSDTVHFPLRFENKNVSGGTSNTSMFLRGVNISRVGRAIGRPRSTYFNTTTVSTLKTEPGTLHRIVLVRNGNLGNNTFNVYDCAPSPCTTNLITSLTFGSTTANTFEFDIDFNNGLTVDPGSANFQATVVWE